MWILENINYLNDEAFPVFEMCNYLKFALVLLGV